MQNLDTGAVIHQSIAVPAGVATLGLQRSSGTFGWDNEYEACEVEVPAFAIDRYEVTNRQFLEFMEAGGYQDRALLERRRLGLEKRERNFASGVLEEGRRWVDVPDDVRGSRASARLAGVCQSCGGKRLCAMGREAAPDGGGVASRRVRQRRWKRKKVSVGECGAQFEIGQL